MPDDRLSRPIIEVEASTPATPGLFERIGSTLHDTGRLLVDHVELAALEAQRAAGGLVHILVGSIVITVLVVGAWMALMVALGLWITDRGLSAPAALLIVAALNVAAAVGAALYVRSRIPEVLFAATLRQLRYDVDKENWSNEAPGRTT
jgi:uncharacterized membrane protein YqjE